jgi:hypothetical protein
VSFQANNNDQVRFFSRGKGCDYWHSVYTQSLLAPSSIVERFPEQYPAVLDIWAEPVASDNNEVKALRPMLKNTNLEFRDLKLTYSANRDGWNANAFHKKVDKLGGGLVVCTTSDGLVCGGCE